MSKCMCKFTVKNDNGTVKEKGCNENAVKECRHGFKTCKKHKHGCKNEESFPLS